MGLKEYQAKRDFHRTSEPAGKIRLLKPAQAFKFVIQKHAASHLHYDFRLEMEGVLKSWAVPKGLPVRRGERRLAIQVEDHPVEYGGFEGTIASGNYGAGTVMLWDQGTYEVFGDDPLRSLHSGKIHFVLRGKKLKGEWTLVRMGDGQADKPQWLFLKTGKDIAPLSSRSENQSALTGRSMEQIAGAKKPHEWVSNRASEKPSSLTTKEHGSSLSRRSSQRGEQPVGPRSARICQKRAQTSAGSRRAAPGSELSGLPRTTPRFVEPMKAQLVSKLPKGDDWLYEIKFDGVRALALKTNQGWSLVSRAGNYLGGKYSPITEALSSVPAETAVLDGEVVAVDETGRSSFQLLQSFQMAGSKPPLFYYIFDLLQLDGKSLLKLPLWQRKNIARKLVENVHPRLRFSDSIQGDSSRLMKEMQARGLEGLVGKKRGSPYEPGRRSGAWIKFKWTQQQEFVIGGYTRPKGARSHFGSVLVGYYEGKKLRFAAKVGTGFDEPTLHSLYHAFQELRSDKCPFDALPESSPSSAAGLSRAEMRRCSWVRPALVCEVRFAEWTRDHHLRQPAYLGLREDKEPKSVVREKPATVG